MASVDLDITQLRHTRATFEVRYDNAYCLWDRAGLIWSKLVFEWPELKMVTAEPMVTTFTLHDRFELGIKLDRSYFIDAKPSSSLKEFIEYTETFINLVTKLLEINTYTRLGFRLIYNKYYPDKVSAANTILTSKMLTVPEGKHFNIVGKVLLPHYSIVWEGEATGVKVTLAARDKQIDMDTPLGIDELSPVHLVKHEVIYDIDYYTLNKITKGQLNIKDWIDQAYHLIKRDSKVFMGK